MAKLSQKSATAHSPGEPSANFYDCHGQVSYCACGSKSITLELVLAARHVQFYIKSVSKKYIK